MHSSFRSILNAAVNKLLPALFLVAALLLPLREVQSSESASHCQCTDYVYRQRADILPGMGHAKEWPHSASYRGLPLDNVPLTGDAVVILNGAFGFNAEYGHVAVVIGVNRDHTRFDIAGWDGIKGNCMVEIYTNLPVTGDTVFIHLEPLYR